jgi:hypothetical protein
LNTTTTILLLYLFKATPPKRISKFKQNLHAAILSNTWQASIQTLHTLYYPLVLSLNLFPIVIINLLVPSLHLSKPCSDDKRGDMITTSPMPAMGDITMPPYLNTFL